MLSRFRWVWLAFLFAFSVALKAEVSLWCVLPDGEFPVVGSDHELVVIKREGALKKVSANSEFRLKGDLLGSPFAVLAPSLTSRRNESGRLSKTPEPVRSVSVQVPWLKRSLSEWNTAELCGASWKHNGMLVLAWYDGSQELRAAVEVFDESKDYAFRIGTLSLTVPEDSKNGFASLLFMEEGNWLEPKSRFEDSAMKGLDSAIARSDLKSLGTALAGKRGVLKSRTRLEEATLLDLAAQMGRPDCIEFLVRNGADIEAKSKMGRSSLRRAVAANSLSAAKKLIELGAKVNSTDDFNESALFEAVRVNNPALVSLLLAHGADPSMQNSQGLPPIGFASETGSLQVAKQLEAVYPKYDYKGSQWAHILAIAVDLGYVPLAEYWISKGASLREDLNGRCLVQLEVSNQDFAMLSLLLRSGAAPTDTGTLDKRPPLELAVTLGSTDITKLLLEKGATGDGDKLLAMAATVANLDQVKLLLKSGFRVSMDPKVQVSALDVAILFSLPNSGAVIDELLASGAQLVPSRSTFSAVLEAAMLQDRAEVIAPLLKEGVSPDILVRANWPLSAAAKALKVKRCQALFEQSGAKATAPYLIESPKVLDKPFTAEHSVPFALKGLEEDVADHPTILADLIVDPQGTPVWIKPIDEISPRLRILFERTVMAWTFTKPLKAGVPVGVRVRVPFVLPVDEVKIYFPKQVDVQPGPLPDMAVPVYPYALKASGIEGKVLLMYVITPEGTTKNIEIMEATSREFAESASQAVSKWKFKPAVRGGHPVNIQIAQQIDFKLGD